MESTINLALAIGAGTVFLLGALSGVIKNHTVLSEPLVCLLLGVALGPLGLDAADGVPGPLSTPVFTQVMRLTVAVAVMAAALRLPRHYLRDNGRDLAVVLLAGLPLMAFAAGAAAWALLPLGLVPALIVGAMLAPTDPVLSQTVVGGPIAARHVPGPVRRLLTAESGANDGLALLLVLLPVLLSTEAAGSALFHWVLRVAVWDVLLAVLFGAALGWAGGRLVRWAVGRPEKEETSVLTASLALTLAVLATVDLLGSDGILAVFAAGLAFGRTLPAAVERTQERIDEAVERFLVLPAFIVFGMSLPWDSWAATGWAVPAFAVAVLAVRRLPAWLLVGRFLRATPDHRAVLFTGWFGPVGVAALFYASLVVRDYGLAELWPPVAAVAAASVVAHGITATPAARRYGR